MVIKLSTLKSGDYEATAQRYGRLAALGIKSEEDAVAARAKVRNSLVISGWTGLVGVVAFAAIFVFPDVLTSVLGHYPSAGFITYMLLTLCGVFNALRFLHDLGDTLGTHDLLSAHPAYCQQLYGLVGASPAVRDYISSVNASDRQLRVFDIAVANKVHEDEQDQQIKSACAEACALLHSV